MRRVCLKMISVVECIKVMSHDENIYLVGDLDNSCKNYLMNLKLLLKHGEDPGVTKKQ